MANIQKINKASVFLPLLAGIVLFVFILWVGVTDDVEVTRSRTEENYVRVEDALCREIRDADTPIGVKKEYSFRLEDSMDRDICLAFYTVHQYVEVWLDGENIYSLKPSRSQRFVKTVGSNWVLIPLYREDAGREIRVEIIPVYEKFRDRKVEFLVGSELAIYKDRLSKDLPQIVLGVMAVFVGFIFVCIAVYNIFRRHRGNSVAALGLFSMVMGIWRLTDTRFTPFMQPDKPVLLFYISVAMLMLGMVPFMKWLLEYVTVQSRCILNIYCMITAAVCLIQLALQFFGKLDLRETLAVTHIEIAVGVLLTIVVGIYESVTYPGKFRMPMGNKMIYLCLAGVVADVAAFYIKGDSSGLLFSLSAFFLYIVFMGIATMYNYSEQEILLARQDRRLAEQDRELAEKERKLTERRIASMMSQIRSHFIFNVLATISGYCKIDPKKADEAVIRFARYLRKNINIIKEEGVIDFAMELEQLEDYVALEQMRFPDKITFEEKIGTESFQIPPLTIQPIVENAIKHGLVEQGKSGIVVLKTEKKENYVEITIVDNGVGFVPEENQKEDSVGIRNVRYRLENMVGGSLDIESVPGEGTKVVIRIPCENVQK